MFMKGKRIIRSVRTVALATALFSVSCDRVIPALSEEDKTIIATRDSLQSIGIQLSDELRYKEAIENLTKALNLSQSINDTVSLIKIHNELGYIARRVGNTDESLKNYYQAYQLGFNYSDTTYSMWKDLTTAMNGVGNSYLAVGNPDKAEPYFRTTVKIESKLNDNRIKAMNHGNLGAYFEQKGMLDSALVQYQMAMQDNQKAESLQGIGTCHIRLGDIAYQTGDVETAISEYKKAIVVLSSDQSRQEKVEALQRLSSIYLAKRRNSEAKSFIDQSYSEAQTLGNYELLYDATLLMSYYEERMGNLKKALEYNHLGFHYLDSLNRRSSETDEAMRSVAIETERLSNKAKIDAMLRANETLRKAKEAESILFFISLVLFIAAISMLFVTLRSRKKRIEEMTKNETVRTAFFTNVTHEFRTPVTIIKGMAELIRDTDQSETQKLNHLEAIERQSNTLLRLVEKLLGISKMSAGVDPNQVWRHGDVLSFIRMVCAQYREYAQFKKISLQIIAKEQKIEMDYVPYYYDRIISNLMSNALKFAPAQGYINLTVESQKDNLLVSIEDNGMGVSGEDRNHIFTLFFQGNNTDNQKGSGIGLAYVRQMILSMGGTISINDRKESNGLKIDIVLPKTCPDKTKEITPWNIEDDYQDLTSRIQKNSTEYVNQSYFDAADDNLSMNTKPLIMVVEDNADVVSYLEGLLSSDYRIMSASDGYDALSKANIAIPDLVLTDIMMPGMDGLTLCRTIRKHEYMADIPVIICSAKIEEKDRTEGLESGADCYMTKPIDSQELKENISRLLSKRTQEHATLRKTIQDVDNGNSIIYADNDRDYINQLGNIVKRNMASGKLQIEDIANEMGTSKSTLNRKIRLLTGASTSAYILQIRIDEACRLLSETEMSIGEISVLCGFESLSYFSRVFHQNIAMTPSEYRQKETSK